MTAETRNLTMLLSWFTNTALNLELIAHVLRLVNNCNLELQAEESKVHLLYSKMETPFKSILDIMYTDEEYADSHKVEFIEFRNPSEKWLPLDTVDHRRNVSWSSRAPVCT